MLQVVSAANGRAVVNGCRWQAEPRGDRAAARTSPVTNFTKSKLNIEVWRNWDVAEAPPMADEARHKEWQRLGEAERVSSETEP